MKSLTQITGGKQQLFEGFHDVQKFFEEHLSGEHRTFMNLLRIIESAMPTVYHQRAKTGRPPYDDMAFFRAFFAMNYFAIPTVTLLIKTLKSDPNIRQLCGFRKIPSNSSFSRHLEVFSCMNVLNETLDAMVKTAYKDGISPKGKNRKAAIRRHRLFPGFFRNELFCNSNGHPAY